MRKKGFIEEYEAELRKVWSSERMVKYCLGKVDNVVKLDNGYVIPIEKESIEKDFCFGYHDSAYNSDSYDEANAMACYASESESYFFEENMKKFRSTIKAFEEYHPVAMTAYISGGEYLKSIHFMRGWEICDLFGGSCYMDKVGGTYTRDGNGRDVYILNDEDIKKVLDGYKLAMANHEKRVRTYLKKYGTKHVNSWSYWLDA